MSDHNRGTSDLAKAAEEPPVDCANRVNGSGDQSCLTSEKGHKVDLVESAIVRFQSRSLREAVSVKFNNEFLTEQLENIARGEMLRLLPLWIQARIFSFISVEERVRVLETISGGQVAGQRTQANFRRAVLESYKTVKNVKDFGTKWSKLRLLRVTGGLENLRTRFPKLEFKLNGSELQGFIFYDSKPGLSIIHLSGLIISVNIGSCNANDLIFVQGIEPTSVMIILNKAVRLINLVDHSVRNCAPTLHKHDLGAAALFKGFVYVVGCYFCDFGGDQYQWGDHDDDPRCCERYKFESDSWERIADMNYGRFNGQLVIWNDSLYAVGGDKSLGNVERYDPENNTWTVVFKSINVPLHDATAVVFEDTLYCCYSPGRVDGNWKVDIVDMQTGDHYTNLGDGLPTPEERRHECDCDYGVYVMEDQLCLLQLCDIVGVGVKWMKFVRDQSHQKWQCTDSGIIKSMLLSGAFQWVSLVL